MPQSKYSQLLELLSPFQQEHLLSTWNSLNSDQQDSYAQSILQLDLPLLAKLYSLTQQQEEQQSTNPISPMPFELAKENVRRQMWIQAGESLLSEGSVAAFLVAGGQGSRLGFEGPKGAFDIGLPSQKSLFQLQAERLLRLQQRYGHGIPWCIMTSPLNHLDTIDFFEEHQFFGLDRSLVRFFSQAMIPAMDTQGKILMEGPGQLALVPDGNGGCFRALSASGALDWLSDLGIRFVFLYSVDNALVKVCDPFMIGALACGEALSASKVVAKRSADERVGIFALRDGLPMVIEYSDLPDSLRLQRNTSGQLQFDGGNIAVHLFRMEALRTLQDQPLPWHKAFKKVNFWNPDQGVLQPSNPNAWKFEQFLFDAFPILGSMMAFGVERESEFAPVKNADGNDSPLSARTLLGELHRQWLIRAKAPVQANTLYEISPLLSYAGEGLSPEVFQSELGKKIRSFIP